MNQCPHCHIAIESEAQHCAACGTALPPADATKPTWGFTSAKADGKQWPKTESGDYEAVALLATMDNQSMQADALCAMLRAFGIVTHMVPAQDDGVTSIYLGQSWRDRFDYNIYVPESCLQAAQDLMNAPAESDETEAPE